MKNDINLLTVRKETQNGSKQRTYVLFGILLAVGLLAGIVLPARTRSAAQLELSALEHKLKAATVSQETYVETMSESMLAESQRTSLQDLHESRSDILSYLSAIEQALPSSATLAHLSLSGNLLNIAGAAPGDAVIATFCVRLRESGAFSDVFLLSSEAGEERGSQTTMFTLSATLPTPLSGAAAVEDSSGEPAATPDNADTTEVAP